MVGGSNRSRPLAALAALGLWLSLLAACSAPPPPTGPSLPATTSAGTPATSPVVPPQGSRLGVWLGGGDKAAVERLRGTGAGWTRVILSWATVEPIYSDPAHYNFAATDALLGNLAAAGLQAFVEVRDNPTWAASTFCGPIDQAGGLEAFGRFLGALAQRYGSAPYGVKHWELYNEPDATSVQAAQEVGMGCWGNYPREYADMLHVASFALKSADPAAVVVLGGLAHENPPFHFNLDFLDMVLAAGGGDFFDVANVHYFSSYAFGWQSYGPDVVGKLNRIRRTLTRHGLDKPVAITEVSWSNDADPEHQARYLPKVLARALANDVYLVTWFSLADWRGALPYGLFDLNLQPKPSYRAFQVAAAEFGEAKSVRALPPTDMAAKGSVEGYAVVVGDQELWLLWAADGTRGEVTLPPRAIEVLDREGRRLLLPPTGQPLAVDENPVYVHLRP